MPKLKEEDFEARKNFILDNTFKLALENPLNTISIRDIIKECEVSQGYIYRYFKNIDEIYIELINREIDCDGIRENVDNIFKSTDLPEKVIFEYMTFLNQYVLDNILGIGKVYYELTSMYANDLNKLQQFLKCCNVSSEYMYMNNEFFSYLKNKMDIGYFKTKTDVKDIQDYVTTFFDGLTRNLILSKYFSGDQILNQDAFNKDTLVNMLYMSLICLLNSEMN